jgi:hypothetical protein
MGMNWKVGDLLLSRGTPKKAVHQDEENCWLIGEVDEITPTKLVWVVIATFGDPTTNTVGQRFESGKLFEGHLSKYSRKRKREFMKGIFGEIPR